MASHKHLFASAEAIRSLTSTELAELAGRYPYVRPLQIERARRGEAYPPLQTLVDPWRAESSLLQGAIAVERVLHVSADDLIDRFLRTDDLRIVAEEGEVTSEVVTEAQLDEEDCLVSEELAEIYRAQGLFDQAEAIYRQLSLRNPEKSIYFAEQIDKLRNNN
ncbi:MAG: hypothetical protein IKM37_03055 [Alistipes sp.]|nr:hypothetical protein [Alistipes sp.]MBR7170507.1 hypothetical protein [Alistipes sp.]